MGRLAKVQLPRNDVLAVLGIGQLVALAGAVWTVTDTPGDKRAYRLPSRLASRL
jgi:hypothetical protein